MFSQIIITVTIKQTHTRDTITIITTKETNQNYSINPELIIWQTKIHAWQIEEVKNVIDCIQIIIEKEDDQAVGVGAETCIESG